MSCISLYTSRKQGHAKEHNEVAICSHSKRRDKVALNYWLGQGVDGNTRHFQKVMLDPSPSHQFISYKIEWQPTFLRFSIDDKMYWDVRGEAKKKEIPWEKMSIRLILRPDNIPSVFKGPAQMDLGNMTYTPWQQGPIDNFVQVLRNNMFQLILAVAVLGMILYVFRRVAIYARGRTPPVSPSNRGPLDYDYAQLIEANRQALADAGMLIPPTTTSEDLDDAIAFAPPPSEEVRWAPLLRMHAHIHAMYRHWWVHEY
uniref:GH16 domain-containing protein n=1 Tax=Lotharella oceanica TaxID=641309 RepID=A0A7S2TG90_9EUKA